MAMKILSTHVSPITLACLASRARRVVQIGARQARHTVELARGVHANTGGRGGIVVCAELDTSRLDGVRAQVEAAGLDDYLLEYAGDARCTLQAFPGPIDFVLLDCPADVAAAMLTILEPRLAPGAVVLHAREAHPVRRVGRPALSLVR